MKKLLMPLIALLLCFGFVFTSCDFLAQYLPDLPFGEGAQSESESDTEEEEEEEESTVDTEMWEFTLNRSGGYSISCKDKNVKVIEDIPFIISGKLVTEIAPEAFKDCDRLEKVVLHERIRVIGESAFEGCLSLKEVQVPDELKTIGPRAFYNCISLETFDFPKDLEAIGNDAFNYCKLLKKAELGEMLMSLIENKKFASLRDEMKTMHAADIAAVLEECKKEQAPLIFRLLPKELAAETLLRWTRTVRHFLFRASATVSLKKLSTNFMSMMQLTL